MSKIWFVTGASRGLGRKIVEAALADGDSVVATARDVSTFNDLVVEYGERILPLPMDVTDIDAVNYAVAKGHENFGHYDVIVNNAGYGNTAALKMSLLRIFTNK